MGNNCSPAPGRPRLQRTLSMDILKARRELRNRGSRFLLGLVFSQKESLCLLNNTAPCPYLLKYATHNFCVSELLDQGCQNEKAGNGAPEEALDSG